MPNRSRSLATLVASVLAIVVVGGPMPAATAQPSIAAEPSTAPVASSVPGSSPVADASLAPDVVLLPNSARLGLDNDNIIISSSVLDSPVRVSDLTESASPEPVAGWAGTRLITIVKRLQVVVASIAATPSSTLPPRVAATPAPTPRPTPRPTPSPTPTPKPNKPPKADAGTLYEVSEGPTIRLDGRGSKDSDGAIRGYRWSPKGRLDDPTDDRPRFQAVDEGVFEVTLTVTDDDGATDQDTARIRVYNMGPDVERVPDTTIGVGEPLYGTFAFTDPGVKDKHRVRVDWGDGTIEDAEVTEKNGSGSAYVNHTYSQPGTYDAQLTVIDDRDMTMTFFTVTVK